MAVDVGDVKQWAVERGKHHVVLSVSDGYVATACGVWGNTMRLVDGVGVPPLLCRRCRRALPKLRPSARGPPRVGRDAKMLTCPRWANDVPVDPLELGRRTVGRCAM